MMGDFTQKNRIHPMWVTVAYNTPGGSPVPMFRALALALDHAHDAGARFTVTSADRRPHVLNVFNKHHGTHLHSQQYLYDNQHEPGFFPADKPNETSHCLFSDGNPYFVYHDKPISAGRSLPLFMLGIDLVDDGTANSAAKTERHLRDLGYKVVRPYHSGAEAHHINFVLSPITTLRAAKRIPAIRL